MPIRKIKKGGKTAWQWGTTGKGYKRKSDAVKQMKAIYASGWKEKGGKKK